jgi:hypothetical protein
VNSHWQVMTEAATEVGPALFFCLLIITLVVHSGVHPASARGSAVRPAGFHQDLRHGCSSGIVSDLGAGADGLLDSGTDS